MSSDNIDKRKDPIGTIAAVVLSMGGLFAVLQAVLPSGLTPPIAALALGLVLTGALVRANFLATQTALLTWAGTSISLVIVHLIISQPATIVGSVIENVDTPLAGLALVLTDSSGIDHRVITNDNGQFEIYNVPEGRYTIIARDSGRLLISGVIPSGWQRIFAPTVNMGEISLGAMTALPPTPSGSSVMTNTPNIVLTEIFTLTPTYTPTLTYTPTYTPTLTYTPTRTPTPRDSDGDGIPDERDNCPTQGTRSYASLGSDGCVIMPRQIVLRSVMNGLYVRGGVLTAGMDAISPHYVNPGWETFNLIVLESNGTDIVVLQSTINNLYVRGGVLTAGMDVVSPHYVNPGWEAFELIDLGNSIVALRCTINGLYVRAGVPTAGMNAVSPHYVNPGWEAFELIDVTN